MVVQPDGILISPWGLAVLGYPTSSRYDGQRELTIIEIPTWDPGAQTTEVRMEVNFDARTCGVPFDIANPESTAVFTQDTIVYDMDRKRRRVTLYFAADCPAAWTWHVLASGYDVDGASTGRQVEIARGRLTFSGTGDLARQLTDFSTVTFAGNREAQTIAFDFSRSINAVLTRDGTNDNSSVNMLDQTGRAASKLIATSVEANGTMIAHYEEGYETTPFQLALASVLRTESLTEAPSGLLYATYASGAVIPTLAGHDRVGTISPFEVRIVDEPYEP